LLALAKPRVNTLVVLTTAAGFYLASGNSIDLPRLLITIAGTGLVAGGAAAFNQVSERESDRQMHRTRMRPLADGRLEPQEATAFGLALTIAGLAALGIGTNVRATVVALATIVTYTAVYTPLKRRTWMSALVGAVPGALPPLIGWAAARDAVSAGGWALFAIVFVWQIPHVQAIAWMYRDDYQRAGFPVLSVTHPDGRRTAREVMVYASALIPVSLGPAMLGLAGSLYVIGALVLGMLLWAAALRFAARRTLNDARRLFLGSLVYLPLLWALLIADNVRLR
jgi:protoheme IX farnesyltransferase